MTHKITRWLPVFLWAGLIFYFSTQPIVKASETYLIDFLIKKSAHVFEYATLFFLITRAQEKKNYHTAFFLALAYAFTDEIHQLFTPGRTGTIRDVLVFDLLGISATWFYISAKK